MLTETSKAPYYAVIFSAKKTNDLSGYEEMATAIVELAEQQEGFLGIESAQEGFEITVSYLKDEKSIQNWYANIEHQEAQKLGKSKWYESYNVRVAKVERAYSFKK